MTWSFDFRSFLFGLALAGGGALVAMPFAPPAERPTDAKPAPCECPEIVCPEWDCPTCPPWPGCKAAGCWEE